ncbi:hypothetical protein GCM10010191_01110 [Actinomadura vinacea]|uniref:Uncharacterized protein n=1 Tax=Actinomadura vinacea TaxID=115336 RepID=A0ABN3I938_9ACTN
MTSENSSLYIAADSLSPEIRLSRRGRPAYAASMLIHSAVLLWRPVPKRIYRPRSVAGPIR